MHARIDDGAIVDRRSEPMADGDWRPIVIENRQPYDPETHNEACTITIEPDRVVMRYRIVERDLPAVQAELLARLADYAERARGVVLTLAAGKSMSYAEKAAEARLILDDESNPPPAEAVPILSREAAVRGLSLLDMARLVMGRYLACKDAEASINEIEVRANLAIGAASTAAQARAAYEAVTWPSMQ
jgi:hypothetical protein